MRQWRAPLNIHFAERVNDKAMPKPEKTDSVKQGPGLLTVTPPPKSDTKAVPGAKSGSEGGAAKPEAKGVRTLAIDIGGSGVKAMLLDNRGKPLSDRLRAPTPKQPTPEAITAVITSFAAQLGDFQRASVGFPGVVRKGTVYTAHNLDPKWINYPLAENLSTALKKPVRAANDAVVQGLGAVSGNGVELVITLGTGMGSALYIEGTPVPSLELAHHPFRADRTYEDDLGRRAFDKHGPRKWNKHLAQAIEVLHNLFFYDRLYIGGGNARKITLSLPPSVKIISNEEGLLGGIKLWSRSLE